MLLYCLRQKLTSRGNTTAFLRHLRNGRVQISMLSAFRMRRSLSRTVALEHPQQRQLSMMNWV